MYDRCSRDLLVQVLGLSCMRSCKHLMLFVAIFGVNVVSSNINLTVTDVAGMVQIDWQKQNLYLKSKMIFTR